MLSCNFCIISRSNSCFVFLHSLEIGEGWAPAILNSQSEVDFLKQAQKDFGDNTRSFWIGGSTNAALNKTFDFNSYLTGDSGDYYFV